MTSRVCVCPYSLASVKVMVIVPGGNQGGCQRDDRNLRKVGQQSFFFLVLKKTSFPHCYPPGKEQNQPSGNPQRINLNAENIL